MKKAVLYARVSSDLQKKEKTIDSQIIELKKQIINKGDILVREYIDDGYSGARLDRPGMDELRKDLKTSLFDTIYVLNTDRIAREVTYQTIIIGEILRYKKQIIINGKDYIHNPENKFTLTVLGAVSELERAKIMERTQRGKQLRLRQGQLLGCGNNVYGYDYHVKTPTSPPYYTINEKEAETVKHVFERYAHEKIGIHSIVKDLNIRNVPSKKGSIWRISSIKELLSKEMYIGIRYFNTMKLIKDYANPLDGTIGKRKIIKRQREDWIGIQVPQIITVEIFNKVTERRKWNKEHYRNPKQVQLLSSLVKCGECHGSMFAYKRHYTEKRMKELKIYHTSSYRCSRRFGDSTIPIEKRKIPCTLPEVRTYLIEDALFKVFKTILQESNILKQHVDFFKKKGNVHQIKIQKDIEKCNKNLEKIKNLKKNLVELYVSEEIDKEIYINKNLSYDNEINRQTLLKQELLSTIPLLHKKDVVEQSIVHFSNSLRTDYDGLSDFDSKRNFVLKYIDKVVYKRKAFEVYGKIPIINTENTECYYVTFCVKDKI